MTKPSVQTKTVITKTVEMTLEPEEIEKALQAYLVRHYAEFRNMELSFAFNCYYGDAQFKNVTATAKRVKES